MNENTAPEDLSCEELTAINNLIKALRSRNKALSHHYVDEFFEKISKNQVAEKIRG